MPSRKTVEIIKLQFSDEVVVVSVDMQRSVQTMLKTVEGAQVQHNDKVTDVPVGVHLKTASSSQCVPCRKLRKSHIIFFDGDSSNLDAGSNNARGTENCGSSLKE